MSKQLVLIRKGAGDTLQVLGTYVRFLCAARDTDHAFSLMEVTLPRHAGPPPHHHPWDEAYYVLEGRVRFSIAGQEQVVSAGELLYAPAGTVHGFQGDAEAPSRMLIIDSPAHAEAFFRDVDREVKGPGDLAKVPAIGRRNQIYFEQGSD